MQPLEDAWQAFIEGPLFADSQIPWRDDAAFEVIAAHAGLRDSIGGHVKPALLQAIGLVSAMAQVELLDVVQAQRPAQGLCLGVGTHVSEALDVLQVFELDCVHAYEWIRDAVIEVAQALEHMDADPDRIRLHHGSLSDLSALSENSIRVIYTANVFTWEVPMMPETFDSAMAEIRRVLAVGGILLSRGSAGVLENHLVPYGRMLLSTPLVTVFQHGFS